MGKSQTQLTVFGLQRGEDVVLRPSGLLDSMSYTYLRDVMLKAALELPRSVIVNVNEMMVHHSSCWTVFPTVQWQVNLWPDVPINVVCDQIDTCRQIMRSGITRYIELFPSEAEAEACAASAAGQSPRRRRIQIELPGTHVDSARIRSVVDQTLHAWRLDAHVAASIALTHELTDVAIGVLPGTGCTLRLESTKERIVAAVTRRRGRTPQDYATTTNVLSPHHRRRLNQLGHLWGHASTADRTTLWAVIRT